MKLATTVIAILLCLALNHTASADETITENGLTTSVFDVPEGQIKVNYPGKLAAGGKFTGTVKAEPSSQNEKEQREFSDRIGGYVIEINDSTTASAKSGKFQWVLPAGATALALVLKDADGNVISRSSADVIAETLPERLMPGTAENFHLPEIGQVGHPVRADGIFDGDFNSTGIELNNKPVDLLAESEAAVFFETPDDRIGLQDIKLTENDVTVVGRFRSIGFVYEVPKTSLVRGEKTTLKTTVVGLDGLEQTVRLRLINETPSIVSVENGSLEIITINPEDVSPEGDYTFTREITAQQSGGYELTLTLLSGEDKDPCEEIGDSIDSLVAKARARELEADSLEDEAVYLDKLIDYAKAFPPEKYDEMAKTQDWYASQAKTQVEKEEYEAKARQYREIAKRLREYKSGERESQRKRAAERIRQDAEDLRAKRDRLRKEVENYRALIKELRTKHDDCLKKMGLDSAH